MGMVDAGENNQELNAKDHRQDAKFSSLQWLENRPP